MYPILISIFFYFQQLDCRQILSGKMINAILFIFYQEVMKQKMNKPFDIHRNIQKQLRLTTSLGTDGTARIFFNPGIDSNSSDFPFNTV
jgi:hypothetical protein